MADLTLTILRLAILNIPAGEQVQLFGKDSTAGMAYNAGHFSARMAAARLVSECEDSRQGDAQDAARYRYWRDNACRRPSKIAVALATAIFPEQIDEALDALIQDQQEN